MRRLTIFILAILTAVALPVACSTEKQTALLQQEENIDKYIKAQYSECEVVRNGGSNRVIVTPGEGQPVVAAGDSVYVTLEGRVFNSSPGVVFFSDELKVKVSRDDLMTGLYNGLVGMTRGEEAYIFFSAKYGFDDNIIGVVPSLSAIMFHVNVRDIKKSN